MNAAVDAAKKHHADKLIDSFVLGNPHESIFPRFMRAPINRRAGAGVMETFSAASGGFGGRLPPKPRWWILIELRLARGMCGKSYLMLTGTVSAVAAAIVTRERGRRQNAACSLTARSFRSPTKSCGRQYCKLCIRQLYIIA